jgi:hypothetical protein
MDAAQRRQYIQDGDAQDDYMCAFDAEHCDFGITLCDTVQIQRVRLCRRHIGWRGTVKDIVYEINRVRLGEERTQNEGGGGWAENNTRGNEDESKSELFGESGQVRRYVDVQLKLREMGGD